MTLTIATTAVHTDGTYFYSDEPTLSGYDCLGCSWACVAVETAAAYTGSFATFLEVFGVN